MITVWGRATSSNVQIVMWAIGELGLAHRRLDVGHAYGGLDTPEYIAMNPHRLVPTIRDGEGPPIWESSACLRYLGASYGGEAFWPTDAKRRAQLDMWAEWVRTSWQPVIAREVFWPLIRTPASQTNAAAIAEGVVKAGALAKLLDARLDGPDPYLGGEALSFADVMAGHLLYRYFDLPIERPSLPALEAYYARLQERPAYAEHVMVSYESLRA